MSGELCENVRTHNHGLPILHIGSTIPEVVTGRCADARRGFSAESLLLIVRALVETGLMKGSVSLLSKVEAVNALNGRRREDTGPRRVAPDNELKGGE
jgi:hypothetical protein